MDDSLFTNFNEYPNYGSGNDNKLKKLLRSSSTDICCESDESKDENNKGDEDNSFESNECHCQDIEDEEEEEENEDTDNEHLNDIQKRLEDHKVHFQERFKNLNESMITLRKRLSEEKDLWRRELEDVQVMQPTYYATTPDAIVQPVAARETETYEDTDNSKHVCALTNPEYQTKISEFEEALFKAHAEKRAQLKRQISISNYKRRLLEVENMCNLELLRVKQSVQFLQPLQVMASEWNAKSCSNKTQEISIIAREGVNSQLDRKVFNKTSSAAWNSDQDQSGGRSSSSAWSKKDYLNSSSNPNLA